MPAEKFCRYSMRAVFGSQSAEGMLFALRSLFTIHESQLAIFRTEFAFARNKAEDRNEPRMRRATEEWPDILRRLETVRSRLAGEPGMRIWLPHFDKPIIAHKRSRVIYDLALASLECQRTRDPQEKRCWLFRMQECNREDFALVRDSYLIPCHELERVIFIRKTGTKCRSI